MPPAQSIKMLKVAGAQSRVYLVQIWMMRLIKDEQFW